MTEAIRLEQMKLVYDYIKFHIGLFLATPPVLVLVAEGFGVKESFSFRVGLMVMIGIYIFAGGHAGYFMGRHVNTKWNEKFLENFDSEAYKDKRRRYHHTSYWWELVIGLASIGCAKVL